MEQPQQTFYDAVGGADTFQNWVQVGVDLVAAVQEGIHNVLGGAATEAPVTVAPPAQSTDTASDAQRSASSASSVVAERDVTDTTDVAEDATPTAEEPAVDQGPTPEAVAPEDEVSTEGEVSTDDPVTSPVARPMPR